MRRLVKPIYKGIVKPLLFTMDAEVVHERFMATGELLGRFGFTRAVISGLFKYSNPMLEQEVSGIHFANPIGLAAGFDYDAKLTQIIPSVGFGYHTVGTVTNIPYEGNPRPRLGRLPKSRSLLVNKGFKSNGAKYVSESLSSLPFAIPLGVSIGRSNSPRLEGLEVSIADILKAFKIFEESGLEHSYYELNISCPNLIHGNVTFYPGENLEKLLTAVDTLDLSRPVFIKMPINKSDDEVREMLSVITQHTVDAVIFGNLQKDRNHPSLDQAEVAQHSRGYFSGKPTFTRSNELISLAYQEFGDKLTIIGTGGVFTAEDAYEKITRGATLVQLITGMIYEGPQVIGEINQGLVELLNRDGYSHIAEAIGSKYNS